MKSKLTLKRTGLTGWLATLTTGGVAVQAKGVSSGLALQALSLEGKLISTQNMSKPAPGKFSYRWEGYHP
jgi:hypothetical protein